jgi:tRNA nucleotidyltransferase (CCA-adding enzyme)
MSVLYSSCGFRVQGVLPSFKYLSKKLDVEKQMPTLHQVTDEILRRVVPSSEEREHVRAVTELVRTLVVDEIKRAGLNIDVEVGGSVAKDTWLSRDVDIDLFILFPTSISKKELGELGLRIARQAVSGYRQRERYAEHAYLEAWMKNVRVNIVPCYRTSRNHWLSAADRSPYHTRYVIDRLQGEHLEDDIRVFKKFAKGIGVYGAEIRVKGFSGYLCELLILHYGSFPKALKAISEWRFGDVVDMENLYRGRIEEARTLFAAPLIVIDPVDENRNVAAAVSKDRLSELIAAARVLLEAPSTIFFCPTEEDVSSEHLKSMLSSLKYDLVAIEVRTGEAVPDILWGELNKTQRALRHILEDNDFVVLRSDVWSDEIQTSAIVFSLEAKTLGRSRRHLGPPGDTKGVIPFLEKFANDAVTGPWVENGKWVVGVKRRYTSAESLLKDTLSDGGCAVGASRGLIDALTSSRLLVGSEILSLCSDHGFAGFIRSFIAGRPHWLPTNHSSSLSGSFS